MAPRHFLESMLPLQARAMEFRHRAHKEAGHLSPCSTGSVFGEGDGERGRPRDPGVSPRGSATSQAGRRKWRRKSKPLLEVPQPGEVEAHRLIRNCIPPPMPPFQPGGRKTRSEERRVGKDSE